MASLKHQLMSATSSCFEEGRDKHSDRRQSNFKADHKIYSHTDFKNTRDFANNFCNFIKANYSEVKQVKQITSEMSQSFLNLKAEKCTQNTLEQYKSKLDKLEKILNFKFKSANVDFSSVKIPKSEIGVSREDRGAESQMPSSDYEKLMKYASEKHLTSKAILAVQICREIGFRVEEIAQIRVENIDLKNNRIVEFEKTKGGKEIYSRDISNELKQNIQEEIKNKKIGDTVISIKSDSVNKWLNRTQKNIGLERHSVHDLRRLVAQERFDKLRVSGVSKQYALKDVSNFLNHGDNRDKLLATSYLDKIY